MENSKINDKQKKVLLELCNEVINLGVRCVGSGKPVKVNLDYVNSISIGRASHLIEELISFKHLFKNDYNGWERLFEYEPNPRLF